MPNPWHSDILSGADILPLKTILGLVYDDEAERLLPRMDPPIIFYHECCLCGRYQGQNTSAQQNITSHDEIIEFNRANIIINNIAELINDDDRNPKRKVSRLHLNMSGLFRPLYIRGFEKLAGW